MPLGLTTKQVLARFGPPASGRRYERLQGLECVYYDAAQSAGKYQWRLCFRRGRLEVVATYLR